MNYLFGSRASSSASSGPSKEYARESTSHSSAKTTPPTAAPGTSSSSSLWQQWNTGTGWFGPLNPPESPEELAEKRRREEERRRQQKEASVHTWRPSQYDASQAADASAPTTTTGKQRPASLMRRLSSAVELKWWAPSPSPDPNNSNGNRSRAQSSSSRARTDSTAGLAGEDGRGDVQGPLEQDAIPLRAADIHPR